MRKEHLRFGKLEWTLSVGGLYEKPLHVNILRTLGDLPRACAALSKFSYARERFNPPKHTNKIGPVMPFIMERQWLSELIPNLKLGVHRLAHPLGTHSATSSWLWSCQGSETTPLLEGASPLYGYSC